MSLVSNYRAMPMLLKVVVALGLAAPIVALASVVSRLSDTVAQGSGQFSEMSLFVDLFVVVVVASPLCISAFFIIKRQKLSRAFFLGSWGLLSFSPFFFTAVQQEMETFWLEFTFNIFLGLILGAYLFFSNNVSEYFRR